MVINDKLTKFEEPQSTSGIGDLDCGADGYSLGDFLRALEGPVKPYNEVMADLEPAAKKLEQKIRELI